MPKKVDLSIPEPRLCPGYREYTSTRVPWLPGFDGNVHFTPWPELDKEVKAATSAIDLLLSKRDLQDAANHLWSARRQACPRKLPKDGFNVDARPVFTDCTSVMPIMSSMFSGINEIVQLLKQTRKFTMVTKRVCGRPTELPKDPRSHGKEGKRNKIAPPPPNKERVPDYTLMRLSSLDDIVGEPICAFELKGPGLDILGTPSSTMAEMGVLLAGSEGQVPVAGSDTERRNEPQGSQSIRGTVTAEVLCKRFNELLAGDSTRSSKGRRSGEEPKATARKPLVQALSYALSVQSGCVFLFNYLVGFAIQVVGEDNNGGPGDEHSEGQSPPDERSSAVGSGAENGKKIVVRVSNPLFCNEDPGPLDGIIAVALLSIGLVEEDETLSQYIQNLAEFIDAKSREEGPPEDSGNTDKGATGSKRGISFNESAGNQSAKRAKQAQAEEEVSLTSSVQGSEDRLNGEAGHTPKTNSINVLESTSIDHCAVALSELGRDCTKKDSVKNADDTSNSEEMAYSYCTSVSAMDLQSARKLPRLQVIGHGRSGNIILSNWKGRELVIKEWNGIDEEGRSDLMHETSILNSVMEVSPSLLGSVIPQVFISWSPPVENCEEEPIIVMEYVGESISVIQSGTFFIGDELGGSTAVPIGENDRLEIGRLALHGLKSLHKNGIIHGDVAVRNLRVQKDYHDSEKKWKVWWLDFGHARRVRQYRRLRSFSREMEDCASLFGIECELY